MLQNEKTQEDALEFPHNSVTNGSQTLENSIAVGFKLMFTKQARKPLVLLVFCFKMRKLKSLCIIDIYINICYNL